VEIDAQHQALFDIAARIEAAATARGSVGHLEELFSALAERALDHFADEERIMREVGYPLLPRHLQEHAFFKRQLARLVSQWNTEGASQAVLVALRGFLALWLAEHVASSDQGIRAFLHGGSRPA
jgi:hemerythrin-like metal-binding protein